MKGRIPRTWRGERDGARNASSVCVLMAAKLNKDERETVTTVPFLNRRFCLCEKHAGHAVK